MTTRPSRRAARPVGRLPRRQRLPHLHVTAKCLGQCSAFRPGQGGDQRALAASQIDQAQASAYRATYSGAVGLRSRLGLTGKRELGYVVDTIRQLAKSGRLSAARMPALFLMLQRNREWWAVEGRRRSGTRVRFGKSRLIFQYYPGHGLQIQPLANFGAANGYWYANKDKSLRTLVDELVSIRVSRSSFTTWEYYFHFGGGSPPWMSGMAQATALQALPRAGTRLSDPTLLAIARDGLGAFEQRTPVGRPRAGRHGAWYALYSFCPASRC